MEKQRVDIQGLGGYGRGLSPPIRRGFTSAETSTARGKQPANSMGTQSGSKETGPGESPQSIVVNFLQFDTKEMVLKKAWQKPIKLDGNFCSLTMTMQPRWYRSVKPTHQEVSEGEGHQVPDTLNKDQNPLGRRIPAL